MELQGSKTLENLNNAFNAEARVTMLYRLYADWARKQGLYHTGMVFDQAAHNEAAHAKIWYDAICLSTGETAQNLNLAAQGEHFEWTKMYSDYAQTARDEGFDDIARKFSLTAGVERFHEDDFARQMDAINSGYAVHDENAVEWICQNCGYHVTTTDAPEKCPLCGHNQGFFVRKDG